MSQTLGMRLPKGWAWDWVSGTSIQADWSWDWKRFGPGHGSTAGVLRGNGCEGVGIKYTSPKQTGNPRPPGVMLVPQASPQQQRQWVNLQLCSLQCFLGPVLEAKESCPEAPLGPRRQEESWQQGRQDSVTGQTVLPSQPSEKGGGAPHCRVWSPQASEQASCGWDGRSSEKEPELYRAKQGFCLTRSGWLLLLADKECLGEREKRDIFIIGRMGPQSHLFNLKI